MTGSNENSASPTRPNAKYKLSRENLDPQEEEKLVFYYDRQRRLDKAPASVRELYEKPRQRFNLLKPLVADKPRATIFFTIIVLCILIFVLSKLGYMDSTYSLDGNKLEINATIFEDTTIIYLTKTINSKEPYAGAVTIGVSPVNSVDQDGEFPVYMHRVFFTLREQEENSFVVPYNSPQLAILLQTEKSELSITIKPKKENL
jgi:hypothetical protein